MTSLLPQPMGHPIALQGMEPLEVEQRRRVVAHRRIPLLDRADIGGRGIENIRLGRQRGFNHLAQHYGWHHGTGQLVGQLKT